MTWYPSKPPGHWLHRRNGLPGKNADFHGANQLLGVTRLDARGRHRVKPGQQPMQKFPAAAFHHGAQALSQSLGTRRPLKKPQQQCAQVEPGPSRENGELGAAPQVSQNFQCLTPVVTRGKDIGGIQAIQQVVGDARALGRRQLAGAHVKTAIQLHGIVVHHLAVQPLRQYQRQRRFAGGGRTDNRNQEMAIHCEILAQPAEP